MSAQITNEKCPFFHHNQAILELSELRKIIPKKQQGFYTWILSLLPNLNIKRNDCQASHLTYGLRVKPNIKEDSARRFSQRQARKAEKLKIVSTQIRINLHSKNSTNIITINWRNLFEWLDQVSPYHKTRKLVKTLLQEISNVAQTRSSNIKKIFSIEEVINFVRKSNSSKIKRAVEEKICLYRKEISKRKGAKSSKKGNSMKSIDHQEKQIKARDALIKRLEDEAKQREVNYKNVSTKQDKMKFIQQIKDMINS